MIRIRLKPVAELDVDTLKTLESSRRARQEVLSWDSWKAGFCTCASRPSPVDEHW